MRPLRLKMTSFGPYAGTQVLDFRDLRECNFFLITGPTGAGKTTILDAICFALYGTTSGDERKGKEMRSHFSGDESPTSVELDFALGDQIYRISREPEQEAIGARGKKVKHAGGATLWRLPGGKDSAPAQAEDSESSDGESKGGERVLASGVLPVRDRVKELLGFESEQFRQVVVLPQGQFRKLLVASSNEREEILEALFQTEIFSRIVAALKLRQDDLKIQLQSVMSKHAGLLERAGVATIEDLEKRVCEVKAQEALVVDRVQVATAGEEAAQAQLNLVEEQHKKLMQFEAANKTLTSLKAVSHEIDEKAVRLENGRRADVLSEARRYQVQRQKDAEAGAERLAALEDGIVDARKAVETAQAVFAAEEARQPARDALRQEIEDLERVREKLGQRQLELAAVTAQKQTVSQLENERNQLVVRQKDYMQRMEQARSEQLKLKERTGKVEGANVMLAQLDGQLAEFNKLQADLRKAKDIAIKVQGLAEASQKRQAEVAAQRVAEEKLHADWVAGQAATLARELVDGQACPVCGSDEHPHPAQVAAASPDKQAVDAARARLNQLEQTLAKMVADSAVLESELSLQQATIVERQGRLGELADKTLAEITALRQSKARERDELEAAAARAAEVEQLLEKLVKSQSGEATAVEANAEKLNSAQKELGQKEERLRQLEAEIGGVAIDSAAHEKALAGKIQYLEQLNGNYQKAQADRQQTQAKLVELSSRGEEVRSGQAKLEADAAEATGDFLKRMSAAGFGDVHAFEEAVLSRAQINALDSEVSQHRDALARAAGVVEALQREVADCNPPDLSAARDKFQQAQQARTALVTELGSVKQEVVQFEESLTLLGTVGHEASRLEGQYGVYGKIFQIANGQNPWRVTFQRFVLGAILDDVLMAASRRLTMMSRGRYELTRAAVGTDLRKSAGLDLSVSDSYTGTSRAASTLSGGESFLASLSLALGLADVVQSYSGGIKVDTIFVDEGFGTLDPEALDLAVSTLIDLQKGGRLVGVISHVPELRERIDARLEVSAGRNGSSARFVVP